MTEKIFFIVSTKRKFNPFILKEVYLFYFFTLSKSINYSNQFEFPDIILAGTTHLSYSSAVT